MKLQSLFHTLDNLSLKLLTYGETSKGVNCTKISIKLLS